MRTIGETARDHGLPAHVLRHWEDEGLLRPERTASGHRRYGSGHDARIELIRCGKTAGFTLDQIAVMLGGSERERTELLRVHRAELDRRAVEIAAAAALVDHAAQCPAIGDCPQCAAPRAAFGFPAAAAGAASGATAERP